MKTMKYKKCSARTEYSDTDACFVGHIAGIKDIVGFHGESVSELRMAFEEAVDDYFETCRKTGKSPQKAYSGRLMRVFHRKCMVQLLKLPKPAEKALINGRLSY